MLHILVVAFQALFLHLLLLSSATRLPLLHRDDDHNLSSPHYRLTRRLATNEMSGFETGLQHLYFKEEYFVDVSVGTPPLIQTLVFDTGSELLWVNCRCDSCDQQFYPNRSNSFADVGCDDLTCYKVDESNRGCDKDRCTYEVNYEDGTQTHGTMATENITIGTTTIPNVPIGCSYKTEGEFKEIIGADGILGLGGGSLSLVSQSGGGVFSYCLGNTTAPGWLRFGYANIPKDNVKWASLISNPKSPSYYYYIDVVGISVGGEALDVSTGLNPDTGEGGVIIDTGTVVTQLAKGVYEALRDKFKEKMSNYTAVDVDPRFDTCYNINFSDRGSVDVPAILFNISSHGMVPPIITLEAKNVLVMGTYFNVYCLTFESSNSGLNRLGSLQQEYSQITIDATRGYVGFGPDGC